MIKGLMKNIKDNLSVVAIIPLILGGLWQVLELASISTSYIGVTNTVGVNPPHEGHNSLIFR
jgi:hypothetical protein